MEDLTRHPKVEDQQSLVSRLPMEEDTTPFDSLPNELLLHIFSYLDMHHVYRRITLVCKRFNLICYNNNKGGVWREMTLTFHYREIPPVASTWLRHCASVRKIAVTCLSPSLDAIVEMVLDHCRNLESLRVNWLTFASSVLRKMEGSSSLRKISVGTGYFVAGVFKSHGRCLEKLTHLEVERSHLEFDFGDEEIIAIADHCRDFQSLKLLSECYELTGKGMRYFLERSLGTLKHLQIQRRFLDDDKTLEVIKRCRRLEVIKDVFVKRATLQALSNLTRLRHLHFCEGSVDKDSFRQLCDSGALGNLRALVFFHVHLSSLDLGPVVANCPEISTLRFDWCLHKDNFSEDLRSVLVTSSKLRTLSVSSHESLNYLIPDVFKDVAAPLRVLVVNWPRKESLNGLRRRDLEEIASHIPRLLIEDYWLGGGLMGYPL